SNGPSSFSESLESLGTILGSLGFIIELSEEKNDISIIELDLIPTANRENKVYCKYFLCAEEGYGSTWKSTIAYSEPLNSELSQTSEPSSSSDENDKDFSDCNSALNVLGSEDPEDNYSNYSKWEDFFDSESSEDNYSDYSPNDIKNI
ncbi:311_t:CDS:2, partial [Racocetra persica]